ncbi:MAG: hypothetical protein A2583_09310 [Bdellovibrionales bacterium RIFOXYD1_FULL_53_11]|nr:MAG: hypothetical protein A2583_09310 [Bdellovibrionales bacterium RIFOXYD1_FULL_53_11]
MFVAFIQNSASATSDNELATNREIVRTFASYHLSRSDFAAARDALTGHLASDSQDFEAWNLLGLVHLKEGNPKAAVPVFEKALENAGVSQKGPLYYNHADALARSGRWDNAKKSLEASAKFAETNDAAEDAIKQGRSGRALPPLVFSRPAEFKLSTGLVTGYDNNVLLMSDAALATAIPTRVGAPYVNLSVASAYQKGEAKDGRRRALELGTNFIDYISTDASRFNTLSGYALASLGFGRMGAVVHGVENQFDVAFMSSGSLLSFYNLSDTLKWKMRYSFGSDRHAIEFALPLFYRKFTTPANELSEYVRSGFGGGLSPSYAGDIKWLAWNIGVSYEYAHASGELFRSHTVSFPASVTFRFSDSLWLTASPAIAKILFYRTSRQDMTLGGSLRFNYAVIKPLVLAAEYAGTKNLSSTVQAEYTKHVVSMAVNYEIL